MNWLVSFLHTNLVARGVCDETSTPNVVSFRVVAEDHVHTSKTWPDIRSLKPVRRHSRRHTQEFPSTVARPDFVTNGATECAPANIAVHADHHPNAHIIKLVYWQCLWQIITSLRDF